MIVYKLAVLFSFLPILASALSLNLEDNSVTTLTKPFIQWNKNTNYLLIDQEKLHIGIDTLFGGYSDQAQYASYGIETQIFKYSKIVIPININYDNFFGYIDLALAYDSIKSETPKVNQSAPAPTKERNIYINFDWYKSFGSRTYYLGNIPLIEAYAGYQITQNNSIIIGRIKNEVGLADSETPWDDDGKHSPMSYWLSRDIYSGIAYRFESDYINVRAAITSGNNPMKGYADYLDHIQSPNLKANNTLNFVANIDINFGCLIATNNKSKLTFGGQQNTINSTWEDTMPKVDGKRRNHVYAGAVLIELPINEDLVINLFAQYTWYLSGLSESSVQNNKPHKRFKDITQSGYFAGFTFAYKKLSLSYAHEFFDRFDSNIYSLFINNNTAINAFNLHQLKALKQSSDMFNLKYHFTNNISLELNYLYIHNPLKWVSYIINNHRDDRLSIVLHFKFD